jgi:hypothetical protein
VKTGGRGKGTRRCLDCGAPKSLKAVRCKRHAVLANRPNARIWIGDGPSKLTRPEPAA